MLGSVAARAAVAAAIVSSTAEVLSRLEEGAPDDSPTRHSVVVIASAF